MIGRTFAAFGAIALAWGLSLAAAGGQAPAPPQGTAPTAPPARLPPEPVDFNDTAGWTSLFDGRTLTGWDGNPAVWKVVDGAITAESTPERRIGGTHLIWAGGQPADFELKLEMQITGLNAGIAYRSWVDPTMGRGARAGQPPAPGGGGPAGGGGGRAPQPPPDVPADPKWNLSGLGMDFDSGIRFNGNVEERGSPRGQIAYRGGIVRTETGKRPRYVGMIGNPDALGELIKPAEWTQLHIIARGNQLTHIVNGQLMAILIDDDPTMAKRSGLVGLQIQTGVGKVSYRNIWLKTY